MKDKIKAWLKWVWCHRTKTIGMLGMGAGYVENHLAQLGHVVPDSWRGVIVSSLGMIIFCVGLYNSLRE